MDPTNETPQVQNQNQPALPENPSMIEPQTAQTVPANASFLRRHKKIIIITVLLLLAASVGMSYALVFKKKTPANGTASPATQAAMPATELAKRFAIVRYDKAN